MAKQNEILNQITETAKAIFPDAEVILFGSRARGDFQANSDFDILVLVGKDKVTREDEIRVKYPLYDIEIEHGVIISPLVLSKKEWETRHKATPFYEIILEEGLKL